ncbi:MAG: hypothetical protein ACHQM6_00065 [Candidatus Kapaibacterium sp.]
MGQIWPQELETGNLVQLVMKNFSQCYGIILSKPLPDRIIFQTRNGQLEISLKDIYYAFDYGYDNGLREEIKNRAQSTSREIKKYGLERFLINNTLDCSSTVRTENQDVFYGHRYLFDDSSHVILSTEWGELFFSYSEITSIDNYSCEGDEKKVFQAPFFGVKDPLASQGIITPNGMAFGKNNNFLSDYYVGGVQMNYGATNWLSMNFGGVYLPLKINIIVVTGGLKFTLFSSTPWHFSIGVQGMYSEVIKTTHLGLLYGAVTYGSWDSELTLLGGYTLNYTDSLGYTNSKNDEILAVQAAQKISKNLKLGVEFFFISNFEIVPLIASIRYFTNNLTIDVGVAFSLYKAGAVQNTPTLGFYVFNVPDFPIVPVISGSYHF